MGKMVTLQRILWAQRLAWIFMQDYAICTPIVVTLVTLAHVLEICPLFKKLLLKSMYKILSTHISKKTRCKARCTCRITLLWNALNTDFHLF